MARALSIRSPDATDILKIRLSVRENGLDAAIEPEDLAHACAHLRARGPTPLLVVDVDEVLALFVQGFDRWLRARGHELRMESFALFSNLYPAGGDAPADVATGKAFLDRFFAEGCHECDPAPGGAQALARLAGQAAVVVLTNAPPTARTLRAAWLKAQGLDYPLVIGTGPKGPAVRTLAACAGGPSAFVDDLLPNLDSVAHEAPHVVRFQMVADPGLRALAPSAPDRHERVDDWDVLAGRLAAVLR